MKKILLSTGFAVLIFALTFSFQDVSAATTTLSDSFSCISLGGVWNSVSSECIVNNLTINTGDTLQINDGITLTVTGMLTNSGVIEIEDVSITASLVIQGTLINNAGATINNDGLLSNKGTFENHGTFSSPYGDFENQSTGILNNYGPIYLTGAGAHGQFNNYGTIYNKSGGVIYSGSEGAPIENHSTGILYNFGTIGGDCTFFGNEGTVNNMANGIIYVDCIPDGGSSATLSNTLGATFNNFGTVSLDSLGHLYNDGLFRNICHGTVNNSGSFSGNPIVSLGCLPSQVIKTPNHPIEIAPTLPAPKPIPPAPVPLPEDDICIKNGQLICKIDLVMLKPIVDCYYNNDAPCGIHCPACPPNISTDTILKIQHVFPPLQQVKAGWKVKDIVANTGQVLITNKLRDLPVSVTPETAKMLTSRSDLNWVYSP